MNIIKELFSLPKTAGGYKRRYKLLNKLGIEKKDKVEVAKAIDSGQLGGGNSDLDNSQFKYESSGVFWKFDNSGSNINEIYNKRQAIYSLLQHMPLYSVYTKTVGAGNNKSKYNKMFTGVACSSCALAHAWGIGRSYEEILYIEETKGPFEINAFGQSLIVNNLEELFNQMFPNLKEVQIAKVTYEELYEDFGKYVNNEYDIKFII